MSTMSPLLTKALAFVTVRLGGKVRKGSGLPYPVHLYGCLGIVAGYGGRENLQVAAVLHDAVEDLGVTVADIAAEFNPDVADLVGKVTEDKRLPWWTRKQAFIDRAVLCCQAVGMLVLADKIDNLQATCREMPDRADVDAYADYWGRFNAGPTQQAWFYAALLDALKGNERVACRSTYPELRTDLALAEYDRLLTEFKARLSADRR